MEVSVTYFCNKVFDFYLCLTLLIKTKAFMRCKDFINWRQSIILDFGILNFM